MSDLTDLPNIGKELEKQLKMIGIESAQQLIEMGSHDAWTRIGIHDTSVCLNRLCALEGAIQGVHWHHLPREVKGELSDFYDQSKQTEKKSGAFDYKKEYKNLYKPKTTPEIVNVPEMLFIMVQGQGNPNTCAAYQTALELLYALSYAIKMSHKSGNPPEGFFEYVVPPLEGLWWMEDKTFDGLHITDKDKLCWTAMIRQPEFVTKAVFEEAKKTVGKKKPHLDCSLASLEPYHEGLCGQIMHIGSYDNEPATIAVLETFIRKAGYQNAISETRKHHEIYLSDPRKTAPEKLKTVIRHPIQE